VGSGTLSNLGTLRPGGAQAAGLLTVAGNLSLGTSSRLEIELGGTTAGTQHDQLSVTGATTLGGTLTVTTLGNFSLPAGQAFTVLTGGSAPTGSFSTQNLAENMTGSASGANYLLNLAAACEGVCWDGGGDGSSWTNPYNWTADTLPGTDSLVYINSPVAQVTLAGSGITVKGLNSVAGSSLTLNAGGALTLASGITPENAHLYMDDVDGFLVATGINLDGDFYNIDRKKLAQLLKLTRDHGAGS
jgi:hypothetical protein